MRSLTLVLSLVFSVTLPAARQERTEPESAAAAPRRVWMAPRHGIEDLFAPGAKWERAKSRVQVFKFYIDDLRNFREGLLPRAVATLRDAGIEIAVEAGGLREFACDGEKMARLELLHMAPLLAAGGTIRYLVLDAPFGYTLSTGLPGNCGWDPSRAVRELVKYVGGVKAALPEVKIGFIEPVPWYRVGKFPTSDSRNDFGDLLEIIALAFDTLREEGHPLDFFHADSPFGYNERLGDRKGWEKLRAIEDLVRARGGRFGLIYNSNVGGGSSDRTFYIETMRGIERFEAAGGRPDDYILQSWYSHPKETLPENKTYTFCYLVNRFVDRLDR